MSKVVEGINGQLGTAIYRGIISLLLGICLFFFKWGFDELQTSAKERAEIASTLAVALVRVSNAEKQTTDRFTSSDAKELSSDINNRITTLAGNQNSRLTDLSTRLRELELIVARNGEK